MAEPKKKAVVGSLVDAESESLLIAAALHDRTVVDGQGFSSSLFLTGDNERLARTLIECAQAGIPATPTNIALQSKDAKLGELAAKVGARGLGASPALLIKRLSDIRSRSAIAAVSREFYDKAFEDGGEDGAVLIDEFESRVLSMRGPSGTRMSTGSDMREVFENIKWRSLNPGAIKGRPTPFEKLDDLMDGLPNGELIIVAARPSGGKTALMMNCIETEILGGGVPLVFSMEMSATALKQRALAAFSRTPSGKMDRPWTPHELRMLADGIKKMAEWKWFIDDTERASIRHILSTARRMKKEHGITSIWVDYLQLCRGVRKSSQTDRRAEVGEVTGELKAMAKELDVPVIALCQIRRPTDVYDKVEGRTKHQKPELHHLKESGDIEQDADQVVLIDRDQRENASKATLILGKNRNGPTGEVPVEYQPHICRFKSAV